MKRILSYILLSIFFLVIGSSDAEACSCAGRPQGVKGIQTCGYYWNSEHIFIGLAEKVEIDEKIGSMKVTFAVERTIRGTNERTFEIFTSDSTAACGYPFKQGERYFVYGRKDSDGKYKESLCGPTTLLKDAEDDLEYVKDIDEGKLGTRIFGRVWESYQPTLKDKPTSKPLSNIQIKIKSKESSFETVTDEKGNYLFKDFPKDHYQVFAILPSGYRELFVHRQHLNGHFAGSCSGNYFSVTKQGSIRGRVVNFPAREIQNPWNRDLIQQPKVSLIPLDDNNKFISDRSYEEKWAYRDKFEYFFDTVPAGNYLLVMNLRNCPFPNNGIPTVFYPGVADQSEATIVTVKENEQLVLQDFHSLPLLKERWFAGAVLNADKTPATNAVVRLLDGNMNSCRGFNLEVKTDEFGRFRLKGLETYEYRIDAYTERKRGQKQMYAKPFAVPKEGEVGEIQLLLDHSF